MEYLQAHRSLIFSRRKSCFVRRHCGESLPVDTIDRAPFSTAVQLAVPRRQRQDPARVMEQGAVPGPSRRPALAHDDAVDACSGALEMPNPQMNSWVS